LACAGSRAQDQLVAARHFECDVGLIARASKRLQLTFEQPQGGDGVEPIVDYARDRNLNTDIGVVWFRSGVAPDLMGELRAELLGNKGGGSVMGSDLVQRMQGLVVGGVILFGGFSP
jgi:hypothetical protein